MFLFSTLIFLTLLSSNGNKKEREIGLQHFRDNRGGVQRGWVGRVLKVSELRNRERQLVRVLVRWVGVQ